MNRQFISIVASVAALFVARSAGAHRLLCEETVNGKQALVLQHYPVTLHYRLTVRNALLQHPSTATKVTDPVLGALGFKWTPPAPFTLAPAGQHTDTFDLLVHSRDECLRFAHLEGESDDLIDDLFTVTFDQGSASCATTVRCGAETITQCIPPPKPVQSFFAPVATAAAPTLGTASSFAALAGTTITNTNATAVVGDLGVSPGSAITGFPPGTQTGGTQHHADAIANQAQLDLTAAYGTLASTACNFNLTGTDLAGLTLSPGVYCFSSAALLSGSLVLDGGGDQSAVFIFQVGSKLTTASNSSVTLLNGAQSCNVFWQLGSSGTLGTGTSFAGNILALTSISLATGAHLGGRALARNGAVTLDGNQISGGACAPCPGSLCNGVCESPDAGVCVPVCHGTVCNGICSDLNTDTANCGSCGNVCPGGDSCVSGTCRVPCNGNLCGGRCVQLDTDRRNCGACGNVCGATQCCTAGKCGPPPP